MFFHFTFRLNIHIDYDEILPYISQPIQDNQDILQECNMPQHAIEHILDDNIYEDNDYEDDDFYEPTPFGSNSQPYVTFKFYNYFILHSCITYIFT